MDDSSPTLDVPAGHRSGFVAICGRPNVGKSTLVNALVGETVAVTSEHPQTTRERLLAVWTRERFQAVLVDTPGLHRARSALNRFMVAEARASVRDVDLVLLLAETPRLAEAEAAAAWQPGEVALEALAWLAGTGHPIALVLTKIDRLPTPMLLLPVLDAWRTRHAFAALVPTSAVTGEGLDVLESVVLAHLREGPRYYDPAQLSDRHLRWHAAELIRGELFEHLRDELPYSCAVQVTAFEERPTRDLVRATIYVERDSQKGMVIGRDARTVKSISTRARARIGELTGRPCDLRIEVAVAKNWTRDPLMLQQLGYGLPEGA